MMDEIIYEPKAYYIFDKAYIDFERLYKIEKVGAYFVTMAKKNISYDVFEYVNEINRELGILRHEVIKMKGIDRYKSYPKMLRKILYSDKENERDLEFLTNNFELKTEQIALLCKQRCSVETFFKRDKTASKNKDILGTIRECREGTNLLWSDQILPCYRDERKSKNRAEYQRNFENFISLAFR